MGASTPPQTGLLRLSLGDLLLGLLVGNLQGILIAYLTTRGRELAPLEPRQALAGAVLGLFIAAAAGYLAHRLLTERESESRWSRPLYFLLFDLSFMAFCLAPY
ncbi:MAG: hypothetical protein M5U26_02705 [Planctomycetota bacterium]|nr:hypothetical protein [Planctomycetota bacterium]